MNLTNILKVPHVGSKLCTAVAKFSGWPVLWSNHVRYDIFGIGLLTSCACALISIIWAMVVTLYNNDDVHSQNDVLQVYLFFHQVVCVLFSCSCVFICMIAAVFAGIHGSRIARFQGCSRNGTDCVCMSTVPPTHTYTYQDLGSCDLVKTSIKDYLILQCALNAIASGVCFWFVALLWKSRYEDFHSGLRFYSYSASLPPHP